MTPHEILTNARALIENPENWFTGGIKNRKSVNQLCAYFAINRAEHEGFGAFYAENIFKQAIGGSSIAIFNDTHTHAEVLAAFDKAIAWAMNFAEKLDDLN